MRSLKKHFFQLLCCLLVFLSIHQSTQAAPPTKILATIPPLAFVAHDVSDHQADVSILLPKGSSPHHYQLKPSDRIKIAEADLIIWLGPEPEPYLASLIQSKPNIALFSVAQDRVYRHPYTDIHLWLDPKAMSALANTLANQLKIKKKFNYALPSVDKNVSVIEVADAFGYLHRNLNIQPLLIINNHEDAPPSFKQRWQLKQILQKNPSACVIITPEGLGLKNIAPNTLMLDPLGYDKINLSFSYTTFIRSLADNYIHCSSAY